MHADLRVSIGGLLLCLLLPLVSGAQALELEYASGVALPKGTVRGIYVGPSGGMYAAVDGRDGRRHLLVHDGRAWRRTHTFQSGEATVAAVGGSLVVAEGPVLSTYRWQLGNPARRIELGRLPTAAKPGVFMLTPDGKNRRPQLLVGTDEGVYACADGECERRAAAGYDLIGADDRGPLVHHAGVIYRLNDFARVAEAEPLRGEIHPAGTSSAGEVVFRIGTGLYALTPADHGGQPHVRALRAVPERSTAIVVGEHVVFAQPGRSPIAVSLSDPSAVPAAVTAVGTDRPAAHVANLGTGASGAYAYGGRAVLVTRSGIARVSALTTTTLPSDVDDSRPGVLGVGDGRLLVGRADAVEKYRAGPRGTPELTARYPTATHLMRNSSPTCLVAADDAIVVGTSDGRVLRLTGDGRDGPRNVETLASVLGYGTAFTDLTVDRTGIWATYDPRSRRQSGLVHINSSGASLQLDTTGIGRPVSCVRRAPGGRLYAGSVNGPNPLHYLDETHGVWVAIPKGEADSVARSTPQIHEIAPVSDDLVYLATSRGVMRWRRGHGYDFLSLPRGLADADIQSVRASGAGCWIAARELGVFYYEAGKLDIAAAGNSPGVDDLLERCLLDAGGGEAYLSAGARVVRLSRPAAAGLPMTPGLLLSTQSPGRFTSSASAARPIVLREGDSLRVHYGLSGFSSGSLVASFTIDGHPASPARQGPGFAVFGPMPRGSARIDVRVASSGRAYASVVHEQPVRVLPYWWTTAFGIGVIAGVAVLFAAAMGSGYSVRQRRLAKQLEALVAARTRDLKAAERKALRASASKSMFLANMSHEIRTPLNAVLGMSDLLLASPLAGDQVGYAEAIQRGGQALHTIVGDILAFAEIDSGSVRRRDADTPLRDLIYRALGTPAERAAAKGLFFGYEVDVPPAVVTDANKVASILGHLLDNAVKFTSVGRVDVVVAYRGGGGPDLSEATGSLSITVTDTGIGVEPAIRERIFGVFEQGDNSNTRRYGGTGLGLAIVRNYVECLGGSVAVFGNASGGAVFEARLPMPIAPAPQTDFAPHRERVREVHAEARCPRLEEQLRRTVGATEGLRLVASPKTESAFVFGAATALDVDAFRQNRAYATARRAGLPIILVAPADTGVKALDGEYLLSYPFDPAALSRLIAAHWPDAAEDVPPASQPPVVVDGTAARASSPASPVPPPRSEEQVSTLPPGATAPSFTKATSPRRSMDRTVAPVPVPAAAERPKFFDLAAEHPLRILVAEDNAMNKVLILTVLTKLGYRADWAENGRVAVDRFAASDYDLILMDVHMPELDGLEASREIRDRHRERPVTICALTANASEEGREECLAAGMDDFMTKPLQVPRLVEVLRGVRPMPMTFGERASVASGGAAS